MMTNTDTMLDSVLEAMSPGVEMTLAEVHGAHWRETGYRTTEDEVRACLERLNHLHAEGREVQIRGQARARQTYMRPIVPGMGATYRVGSDRYACTVVAVSPSGHKVTTRDDTAIRTDSNGMSESQEYRYERDPNGTVRDFYRDSRGRYGNKTRGGSLGLGHRSAYHAYHDYSF